MNSNSTRNPSGKAAFLGVMTAAALMLSYIESLFILVPGIPGIKLGFANLAVVLCLYRYGWKEALFLNAVRIALAAFLFGSMFTMLYSLAGAACAIIWGSWRWRSQCSEAAGQAGICRGLCWQAA